MTLVQATFNNDSLWAFVTGFGEGVNDLRCDVANMRLTGHADTATHYFTKSIGILMEEYKAGPVYIPDVHKVGAFLKSCKEDNTTIRHVGNTLTLKNGNDEFSTPTSEYVMSYSTVDRALGAINAAKKNSWQKLGRADLQSHGNFSMEEIRGLSALTKVVGKDAPVRVSIADGDMTITAGNQRGAKMSRQIEIDAKDNGSCETIFGSHLPKLLNLMPSGTVIFHMGNRSALVLEHAEVAALLILKHQEGADQ
tara:strand:- start:4203 stop:4958 length:756 start_codon:yes stop_codon:yes gene_type:complete